MNEVNMDGEHVIEVKDLVISIASTRSANQAKFPLLQKMRPVSFDEDTDVNKPSVVSIEPYHHKPEATPEMRQTKWESLHYMLRLNPEKKMRDYLEAMAELEQQVRSCYASDINIGSDEFIKMMLLDGCFMLYMLYWAQGATQDVPNANMSSVDTGILHVQDPASNIGVGGSQQNIGNYTYHNDGLDNIFHSQYWYTAVTTIDLVLLENQIPFFVVRKLFEEVTNGNVPITILLANVASFMEDLLLSYPKAKFELDHPKKLHHLLHLCHQYFIHNKMHMKNSDLSSYDNDNGAQSVKLLGWHRTLEYYKAGIEFKKRENPNFLLDIAFCDGVMEIPCLTIDPNTYCLFRNLIAFEETCPQFGNYMTTYVVLLSQFITTPEDVSLLTKRGIIVDQLDGDAEIFDLFRMLARGVTFDFNGEYYLNHICHEMEVQYQMQRLRLRDWLGSIGSKIPDWAHESNPNQFPRR